jgi:ligand-binding SRPBCC domain-containing protein
LHVLEREQLIPAPLPEVWEFFSNPANLARITPGRLRFRIHGESPAELSAGSRIEYRIRWVFFTLRWITRITRWEPRNLFEDVQEKGPYRRWKHTHRFESGGGVTRMRDRVEYELPLGPIGRLLHRAAVRRQLEAIFDHRSEVIAQLFPSAGSPAVR